MIGHLQKLDPATIPLWGKMTVQAMIEHYTEDAVRVASGRIKMDTIMTAPEHLDHAGVYAK